MRPDKPGWVYGINLSPYIFEIQDEGAQVMSVIGPFAPYCHPIYRRMQAIIFHAVTTVSGASPVPASQFAVYMDFSEFEPRMYAVPWSAPMGSSGAAPGVVQIKDGSGSANLLTLGSAGSDAQSTGGFPAALAVVEGLVFNGATWDRIRSASAANLGAQSGLGAALVAPPGEWVVSASPAANIQATVTRASAAGVRHIARVIAADLGANPAPGATLANPVLRDGASGIGSPLWQRLLTLQAVAGSSDHAQAASYNLVGTAGNAMTLEFLAAAGANTFEAVLLSGFDAS
jgi:hypothetical protein